MADDIRIVISADGAGQVEGEFNSIEAAANRAKAALNDFGALGGLDSFLGRVKDAQNELGNLRGSLENMSGLGARIGLASAGGLAAMGVGIKNVLTAAGELQQVEAGFTTMLGSVAAAKDMLREVQRFAINSPFDFEQSAKGVQKLLAMGFSAEDIIPTLEAVGNAVSAAGGSTDDFSGVLLALGQIRTKGKLSQEELNQIAERGVSFQFLQEKLGLTADQMGNIGNAGVKADDAIRALVAGFREVGGGTGMANQMKTITGQFSSLLDNANQLEAAIGNVFAQDASNLIGQVSDLLDKTKDFVQQNPELVRTVGILAGGGLTAGVVVGGGLFAAGTLARAALDIGALVKALRGSKEAAAAAAAAKDGLVASTVKDIAAERVKAGVAGTESNALATVAEAAETAAESKGLLAGATEKAAGKMGLLARAKGLLGKNVFTFGSRSEAMLSAGMDVAMAGGEIPNALPGMMPTLSRENQALARWYALKNGIGGPSALWESSGLAGRSITMGNVLGGAATGLGVGLTVRNAFKDEGYSDATANAVGGGMGLGVAALTIIAPEVMLPAAAAAALGEAIKYGFDRYLIEPANRAAEQGTGAENADMYGADMADKFASAQTRRQKADVYNELAAKAFAAGDETTAESYRLTALNQLRQDRKENTVGSPEWFAKQAANPVAAPGSELSASLVKRMGTISNAPGAKDDLAAAQREANEAISAKRRKDMPEAKVATEGDVHVTVSVTRTPTRTEKDAAEYKSLRGRK